MLFHRRKEGLLIGCPLPAHVPVGSLLDEFIGLVPIKPSRLRVPALIDDILCRRVGLGHVLLLLDGTVELVVDVLVHLAAVHLQDLRSPVIVSCGDGCRRGRRDLLRYGPHQFGLYLLAGPAALRAIGQDDAARVVLVVRQGVRHIPGHASVLRVDVERCLVVCLLGILPLPILLAGGDALIVEHVVIQRGLQRIADARVVVLGNLC